MARNQLILEECAKYPNYYVGKNTNNCKEWVRDRIREASGGAVIIPLLQNQQRIIAELVTSNQLLLKVIQKQDERLALLETLCIGRLESPKETGSQTQDEGQKETAGQDINRQTKQKAEGVGERHYGKHAC